MPARYYAYLRTDGPVERSSINVAAILDMLRYDRATVETHLQGAWLLSSDKPFTTSRWKSFGIDLELPIDTRSLRFT